MPSVPQGQCLLSVWTFLVPGTSVAHSRRLTSCDLDGAAAAPYAAAEPRAFTSSQLFLKSSSSPGSSPQTSLFAHQSVTSLPEISRNLAESITPRSLLLPVSWPASWCWDPFLGPVSDPELELDLPAWFPPLPPRPDRLPESGGGVVGQVVPSPGALPEQRVACQGHTAPLMARVSLVHSRPTFTAGCVGRTATVRSSGKATSPRRSTRRRCSTPRTTSIAGSTAFRQGILVFAIGT